MLIAYRGGRPPRDTAEIEERRMRERTLELQERVRRTLAGQPVVRKPVSQGRLRTAA
jgi:hypothetical protein